MANSKADERPIKAAQYLRMSTEHQRYSIVNQGDEIARYAAARGYHVVTTYADHGRSGLTLSGRPELKRLLKDVVGGEVAFTRILVLDVSRWGRFQDIDESAHYDFMCKRAGVVVEYCGETFANDGSIVDDVMKAIKRAMAAEFSRELSRKVLRGQQRMVSMGFRPGGSIPYGVRRVLTDGAGGERRLLDRGQRKAVKTDRVMLTPGPAEELAAIRFGFEMFCYHRLSPRMIAGLLNIYGRRTAELMPWTGSRVKRMLANQVYIGNLVFGQSASNLGNIRSESPQLDWVVAEKALAPIVSTTLFAKAQHLLARYKAMSASEQRAFLRWDLDAPALAAARRISSFLGIDRRDLTRTLAELNTRTFSGGNLFRVYRVENNGLGWLSSAKFRALKRARYFADAAHGSSEAARLAAVAWGSHDRDAVTEYLRLCRRLSPRRNNSSGFIGVGRYDGRSREGPCWYAHWHDASGRRITRRFYIAKLGEVPSMNKAIQARSEGTRRDVARAAELIEYLTASLTVPR